MSTKPRGRRGAAHVRSVTIRGALLAVGWWIVAEAEPDAFMFGIPIVVLAIGASVLLAAPAAPAWSLPGLARFCLAFAVGSVRGGLDVAWRALSPQLPLAPAVVRFPLRLAAGPGRNLFLGTLNLMPGTLSVALDGEVVEVHALVDRGDVVAQLRALELRVARAVCATLEGADA